MHTPLHHYGSMVRFKNRYLLVELTAIDSITHELLPFSSARDGGTLQGSLIANHLRQSLQQNFGQVAMGQVGPTLSIKYANGQTGLMVVRAPREQVALVWAAITLMSGLPADGAGRQPSTSGPGGHPMRYSWRVMHVAGTIKSAQKSAIRHTIKYLDGQIKANGAGEVRRRLVDMKNKVKDAIMALDA